jgi:hypothetical protein
MHLPLVPTPQTPKHILLSCPTYNVARMELRNSLKIYCHQQLTLNTILYINNGVKALATMISAMKVMTAE